MKTFLHQTIKTGKCGQCSVKGSCWQSDQSDGSGIEVWRLKQGLLSGDSGWYNRNLSFRLPPNLPQPHVPGLPKLFHFHTIFGWNTCDTDSPPCQTVGTALTLCNLSKLTIVRGRMTGKSLEKRSENMLSTDDYSIKNDTIFFFFQMPNSGIGLFSGQLLMPYFQHVYTVARKCIVTSSKIIDKYNVPKIRWEWVFRFLLKMTIKSLQWEKCRNPWVDGLELLWLIKTTPTI